MPVTEDYEYSGVGGRISELTTTVGVGAVEDNTRPVFDYDLVYDALGNVSSRTYPRCTFNFCSPKSPFRTVTGTFTQGLLTAVPGYASSITYHPNGLVNQVSHANGVLDLQEKDPTDMTRPRRLRTSGATEEFDTGVYSWDGAGNVTKMGSFRFAYDLLSRVMDGRMEVPGEGCGQELLLNSGTDSGTTTHQSCGTVRAQGTYRVGSTGNVTLRAGNRVVLGDGFSIATGGRLTLETDPSLDPGGGTKDAAQRYTYDRFGNLLTMTTELEGQNPVTRTLTTNSATNRLSVATYDLSGNVTSWAGRQYRWAAFNILTQEKPTAGNGHTFLYGPGDERVLAIDWTQGTDASAWIETWTLRDLDGTPLRQFRQAGGNTASAHWSFHRDYVYRNSSLLAAHTPQGRHHFHLDHLGSPRLVTNASGDTVAQHLYFPFGEEATDPGQESHVLKFTGHERDDLDSGGTTADLDYQHARFSSPHLGRFLSVDPVLRTKRARQDPQQWNRYTYARSSPLRFIDANGEEITVPPSMRPVVTQLMIRSPDFRRLFLKLDRLPPSRVDVTLRLAPASLRGSRASSELGVGWPGGKILVKGSITIPLKTLNQRPGDLGHELKHVEEMIDTNRTLKQRLEEGESGIWMTPYGYWESEEAQETGDIIQEQFETYELEPFTPNAPFSILFDFGGEMWLDGVLVDLGYARY